MTVDEAARLADTLIKKHLKSPWTFKFNKRRTSLGICIFDKKVIQISTPFVECNTLEKVREVILHEIAHALAGYNAGHGPKWAKECRKLGIEPIVSYRDVVMPPGKFVATCKNCETRYNKQHKVKKGYGYVCPLCKELLEFVKSE